MYKHKKESRYSISNRHIYNLSKKLVKELTNSQLILLIKNITKSVSEHNNNSENVSETFAESIDMDTSHSDISDLPQTDSKSEFHMTRISETSNRLNDENLNEIHQVVSTKNINASQCGHFILSLKKFDPNTKHYSKNCRLKWDDKNQTFVLRNVSNDFTNFNEVEPSNDNNSLNFRCNFQDLLIKNPHKMNSYVYKSVNISQIVLDKNTKIIDDFYRELKIESEEILYFSNFPYLFKVIPISCVLWQSVTPLLCNIPEISQTPMLSAIALTSYPISKFPEVKYTNEDKINSEKSEDLNILLDKSLNQKSVTFNPAVENWHVKTNRLDPKISLVEFMQKRVNSNWTCTYVDCRHLNKMSSNSCRICFNPRWNPHSRFVRNFLCSNCGYVNYKTRAFCKKCNFKPLSKLYLINRWRMLRTSTLTSVRSIKFIQQRNPHFHF